MHTGNDVFDDYSMWINEMNDHNILRDRTGLNGNMAGSQYLWMQHPKTWRAN